MATKTVQNDAAGYQHDEDSMKFGIGVHKIPTAEEIMEHVNKATAFAHQQHMPRSNVDRGPRPAPTNLAYTADTGTSSTSQFNIIGGTIGQAAIGNTGPVTFNQKSKVFEQGSSNSNFNISGGNFSQANLGGDAQYNNKNSAIGAGGGGGGRKAQISPEDLMLHILKQGVTEEQFIKLLERQYSLVNIACALPRDERLKDRMIDALLMDPDVPMEASD